MFLAEPRLRARLRPSLSSTFVPSAAQCTSCMCGRSIVTWAWPPVQQLSTALTARSLKQGTRDVRICGPAALHACNKRAESIA